MIMFSVGNMWQGKGMNQGLFWDTDTANGRSPGLWSSDSTDK